MTIVRSPSPEASWDAFLPANVLGVHNVAAAAMAVAVAVAAMFHRSPSRARIALAIRPALR